MDKGLHESDTLFWSKYEWGFDEMMTTTHKVRLSICQKAVILQFYIIACTIFCIMHVIFCSECKTKQVVIF